MGRFIPTDSTATIGDKYPNRVVYDTPGTYTFTVPDNVKTIKTTVIGGGGNGYEGLKYVKTVDRAYDIYLDDLNCAVCTSDETTGACLIQCCHVACYGECTCNRYCTDSAYCAGGYRADYNICSNAYCMCLCLCNCTSPRFNRTYLGVVAFGGGSGGYADKEIKVVPGSNHTVTVGDSEETSSFGAELSATGAKTEINRCFNSVGFYYDAGDAFTKTSNMPCICDQRNTYTRNCWEANTTHPQFFPTGGTVSEWDSAQSKCYLENLNRNICYTANFVDDECAISSTPGQGIGGDVNKSGDSGTLVEYELEPSDKDRVDNNFAFNICRFVCSPNQDRMTSDEKDLTYNTPKTTLCISNAFNVAYSQCTCSNCAPGTCGSSINCAPQSVFYDSKIKGSVPATENTSAEGYCYDMSKIFTTYQAMPYMCREDFNPIERFCLIRQGYSDGVGPGYSDREMPFTKHDSYMIWGGVAGTSSCLQLQPFDARVETYYRPMNEESYFKYLTEFQRFTPQYAINEILFCCDGYSYEDRLITSNMDYRISQTQCFKTDCYDSSAAHGSNTTYIHCSVDGSKRLIPSCVPCYDHVGMMATGTAPTICSSYDQATTVGTLVTTMQVANTADEAWDIIDNTIKHYQGDYSKIWHDKTYTQYMCRDTANSGPGMSCDCHSLADMMAYFNCARKVSFGYQDISALTKTSGTNMACTQHSAHAATTTYASISGACYECANAGIPGVRMFSTSQAHASVPYMDPEDKFNGMGNCGHGSTFDNKYTTFYKTHHNISSKPSTTEECLKTEYRNAGRGGESSWYKDMAKGKPGLVVVCY